MLTKAQTTILATAIIGGNFLSAAAEKTQSVTSLSPKTATTEFFSSYDQKSLNNITASKTMAENCGVDLDYLVDASAQIDFLLKLKGIDYSDKTASTLTKYKIDEYCRWVAVPDKQEAVLSFLREKESQKTESNFLKIKSEKPCHIYPVLENFFKKQLQLLASLKPKKFSREERFALQKFKLKEYLKLADMTSDKYYIINMLSEYNTQQAAAWDNKSASAKKAMKGLRKQILELIQSTDLTSKSKSSKTAFYDLCYYVESILKTKTWYTSSHFLAKGALSFGKSALMAWPNFFVGYRHMVLNSLVILTEVGLLKMLIAPKSLPLATFYKVKESVVTNKDNITTVTSTLEKVTALF